MVDGSPAPVWARHAALFPPGVRHVVPQPWPGRNGKVAGVMTGVRLARHEHVVLADDDVRWDLPGLVRVHALLGQADLVRPQNVFDPAPWHAHWDTGRTLLNRASGADHPGTYGLRRDVLLAAGGYDGDVLFENLELSRTLRAAGGRELVVRDLYVARRPPTVRQFLGQRVRQAYDDLAHPARLVAEASVLPAAAALARLATRPPTRRVGGLGLAGLVVGTVLLAEVGRRRAGGAVVYPPTAALWAPLWLAERAVCVWLALAERLRGGVRYRGERLPTAAHSPRALRTRLADPRCRPCVPPLAAARSGAPGGEARLR